MTATCDNTMYVSVFWHFSNCIITNMKYVYWLFSHFPPYGCIIWHTVVTVYNTFSSLADKNVLIPLTGINIRVSTYSQSQTSTNHLFVVCRVSAATQNLVCFCRMCSLTANKADIELKERMYDARELKPSTPLSNVC